MRQSFFLCWRNWDRVAHQESCYLTDDGSVSSFWPSSSVLSTGTSIVHWSWWVLLLCTHGGNYQHICQRSCDDLPFLWYSNWPCRAKDLGGNRARLFDSTARKLYCESVFVLSVEMIFCIVNFWILNVHVRPLFFELCG